MVVQFFLMYLLYDFLFRCGGEFFFNLIKYKVVYDFIIYIYIFFFLIVF